MQLSPLPARRADPDFIFETRESCVRSYPRLFPVTFERAEGSLLYDEEGREYIDFLSGAGSLNYGHNNPWLRQRLIEYLERSGIVHSLDLQTAAKREFLKTLTNVIFLPRKQDYVVHITGPTGTNAVEAALKLSRKVTQRRPIVAFTNGFHGMSLGALAATGNRYHRSAAGVSLTDVARMPYDGYFGSEVDTIAYLDKMLQDPSSGIDLPAAIIVETVQGEGGLQAARAEWLQRMQALCRRFDILLIIDDIQAGCGRTGTFFSFEQAGIEPDLVVLSKSLSAFGLPLAAVLVKRRYDQWHPGEHNGTFRGNNLAFVTAAEALKRYWTTMDFTDELQEKSAHFQDRLNEIAERHADGSFRVKGRGMMLGLACSDGKIAAAIRRAAFERGVILETCGPHDEVLKCLPPLTIPHELLDRAVNTLAESVGAVIAGR